MNMTLLFLKRLFFKANFFVASFIAFPLIASALPEPTDEFIHKLKESLVKISVATKSGGHGFGTGVAITKDHVVTNCHVIQNSNGISAAKWGIEYAPVAIQADWKHDVCILRFEWANLNPVELGDANTLRYEQPIISISMPSDSPAPYVALSTIKALYAMDDSEVIRTEAAFAIGASGSPIFDYQGKLIGISTFKSPGQVAYFYNMSVKWVKDLLQTPEIKLNEPHGLPFWDALDENRPFFMQVVLPFQNNRWLDVQTIASNWVAKEPASAEAWYYAGRAAQQLGENDLANKDYLMALSLQANHPATLQALAFMAHQQGKEAEVEKIRFTLKQMNPELLEILDESLKPTLK